jgi:hypothetical protein
MGFDSSSPFSTHLRPTATLRATSSLSLIPYFSCAELLRSGTQGSPNLHEIISFADRHLLTRTESYRYKTGGVGLFSTFGPYTFRCAPPIARLLLLHSPLKSFNRNTYKKWARGAGTPQAIATFRHSNESLFSRRRGQRAGACRSGNERLQGARRPAGMAAAFARNQNNRRGRPRARPRSRAREA